MAKTSSHEAAFEKAVIDIIEKYMHERDQKDIAMTVGEMKARKMAEEMIFDGVAPYSG